MDQYIILGAGSFMAVLFLFMLWTGGRYDVAVEGLDFMEFPFAFLFPVGFRWASLKFLRFQGNFAAELKKNAELIYGLKDAAYYANVIWAQAITYVHFFLTVTLLLAVILKNTYFVLTVGVFVTAVMTVYSLTNLKNTISSRREQCEAQLPEVVSTMAILLNSGMTLRETWQQVSESQEGTIYELMRKSSEEMRNGTSDIDAIYHFGMNSGSAEVKKFSSALLQSMERAGEELVFFMENQSSEMWNLKRQKMLQKGEQAAAKLLIPIMLIFVGVMIIIMTAAFSGALF